MNNKKEIVLIGAGIMSATLAILLKRLHPNFNIKIYEMLTRSGEESSGAMNNAGTGHAGFCELNYTPQKSDGSVDVKKAIEVATQFTLSKEFWAYLVEEGYIKHPENFIHTVPHLSFVNSEKNVSFLKTRHAEMNKHPFFKEMKYSENPEEIKKWIPLVMEGRAETEAVAATKMDTGTDINFEALTVEILNSMVEKGEVELNYLHAVRDLKRNKYNNDQWFLKLQNLKTSGKTSVIADFVFIGAGGGTILLLEKSGIPEAHGFGGFPVGGEWLVCDNEDLIKQHEAKVYGQAEVGAPPMSVPHLDTRVIDGKKKLLFGPFALFSTKFLKNGSYLDLFNSLQINNLGFMTQTGFRNMALTQYLMTQATQSKKTKIKALKKYLPNAKIQDWHEQVAGQRVQVIKKDKELGGILQFGTEVVSAADGSLSALLGASPGASTSVYIMLKVIQECFKEEFKSIEWQEKIKEFMPSLNKDFKDEKVVEDSQTRTSRILKL